MDEPPRFRQSSRKFARAQRQSMTTAETMLWRAVRNHQIDGHGFRQANPDRTLFRGLRLSCAKSSSKRTAARTKRRMRRSRTPTGMHGFDARDFVFFDFQTSSSSADCRSSSNAFVQRCSRHELLFQEALKVADWDVERRDASMKGGGDVRAIELRFTHRATPHPALRATFPSKAGEG